MSIISRLKLDHPALGTPGGVALHQKIEDIYKKIGDNMADRFFTIENFDNSTSVDLDHNFNTNLANLRYDIYSWDTSTGELTLLTNTTTPSKNSFPVVAKTGAEKTHITITNNSGGQVDIVVLMYHDPIELDELTDVDLVTSPPEDGQALVYDNVTKKWLPGASGDASFKLQSLSGSSLTIKGGKFRVINDITLITGNVTTDVPLDIVLDLSSIISNPSTDTTYWLCVDLDSLPDQITLSDTGQIVRPVYLASHFKLFTTNVINSLRYVLVGTIRTTSASWTGAKIQSIAYRTHPFLGSLISVADKVQAQHTTSSSKEVSHNFGKRPDLVTLVFHDESASVDLPIDHLSYITNMTSTSVNFDFSSLTFDTGDYVDIFLYFIPDVRDNYIAATHTFKSPWFVDTSVTEVYHGLSDMDDIASYSVVEWDVTDGKRTTISPSSLVINFDNEKFYLNWTGLNPSSNLRYRIVTGGSALPQALPIESWQVISANYTARSKDKLLCDTSSAGFTVTLPANPNIGDIVEIADAKGLWGTNNLTLNGNGKDIEGLSTYPLDVSGVLVKIIYNGIEWRVYVS